MQTFLDKDQTDCIDRASEETNDRAEQQAVDEWTLENIDNMDARLARNKHLALSTKAFCFQSAEVIATLGELHVGAP